MMTSRPIRMAVGFAMVVVCLAAPLSAAGIPIRISPALPSAGETVNVHFTLVLGCLEPTFAPPVVTADTVLLRGTYPGEDDCSAAMERPFTLPVGPLPAGEYRLQVEMAYEGSQQTFVAGSYALHVEPATDKLLLRAGPASFEVEVAWINQHGGGATGKGRPVRLSEESGYFWFFHPEVNEVTIKILDGRELTSHYWIFLASMTDVDVTVTVRKPTGSHCLEQGTCPTLVYHLPPGAVEGIADLHAF